MTGNSYGLKSTATTHPFQKILTNCIGLLHHPKLHLASGKLLGVRNTLPKQISPYAAADGTPAAEISDVKATAEGKIVQVIIDATTQITITAFLGCPSSETFATHEEKGRTPSRATANTRREAATMAIAVLSQSASIAMTFITTCPPFPSTTA